ncbi:BMC domain-containing protein [Oleidesulfovibrio sp.]|uniref:BMC domain-containing protein n=1 Tax=Oleidesulfovibrio sp. TaxID=2909707 RepID=UPI003A8BB165
MDTLGIVESKSIARGAKLADEMVKVAQVELVRATTVCSGRYTIYVGGDRQAVETAVNHARQSGVSLMGSYVISGISAQVLAVLKKSVKPEYIDALGLIECRTVSAGVAAADSAVKRSAVSLLRLVTGQGINGKSYFVISGDVASVEEAIEAAKTALGKNLIEAVSIPRPDASVVKALTSGVR